MILVDFNQCVIANLFAQLGAHTNIEIEEDLLRHSILNTLRSYNVKFKKTYGEMVIACDGNRNWRKDINPYYKANRKKDRDSSDMDWPHIYSVLNKIRVELTENFPYRVVHVEEAEADDVIGVLCKEHGDAMQKILIISGDKDFRQLQRYMGVVQFDPIRDRYLEEPRPDLYLKEHIIRGDTGDGVCNIKSPANSFVLGVRQKSIRTKDVEVWVNQDPSEFCDEFMMDRYKQNEAVINLDLTPQGVVDKIVHEFDSQANKDRSKLFNYFVAYKLKHLMSDIESF